ncbi:VPS10 domain-containing receptor SorCS2 [Thelohanellus kitauei]|uniref:VPS10 domain-containing receptor SorCS2 n=1 Tax=Thelohanellus kitauei TaxID=669202 RepID=A0A0C2N287_THEKT|nr:VPS10 domain-containing receptor SorCS2 [Thelohanellus kitauei]
MFGAERMTGRIWYSYDEGNEWHDENTRAGDIIDIVPLDSPNDQLIASIYYSKHNDLSTLFLVNFSNVINRTCLVDDYESWYVPRFNGTCYHEQEVIYLKKKPSSICLNNQNFSSPIINKCPCSIEDFPWYHVTNYSEPYYYFKDNVCMYDPFSNFVESFKKCRNGGKPLPHLDGFPKLDPDSCAPPKTRVEEYSKYSHYCISEGSWKL